MNGLTIAARSGRRACVVGAVCALYLGLVTVPTPGQSRFVDDAGRDVQLPSKVTRVFAMGFLAEILLYTLAPDTLVGRNHLPEGAALEFFPPAYRAPTPIMELPDRDNPAGDAELLALKPDLFFDYGTVDEDYVATMDAVQRRTGIPGIILDGRLARLPSTYRRLGAALGEPARGERLASEAERILTRYRGALAAGGSPLRVYLPCTADGTIPCLADQITGDQLAWLGALNVAGTTASAPKRPRTVDEISAMAPDVIVVSGAGAAARLRANPRWQTVSAVARGRVYQLPDLPFSWGERPSSVNRLPGLMWLAYVLPGRPFDTAFYDDLRGFFREFYHVDLTDAQVQQLVARLI